MQIGEERRWWWRPLSAALAVGILGIAGLAAVADVEQGRADAARDDGLAASGAAVELAAAASSALRTLRIDGAAIGLTPALADHRVPEGATAVGVAVVRGRGEQLELAGGGLDPAVAAAPEVSVAAGTARDTGRSVVAAPTRPAGAVVFVLPVYDLGDRRATELPGGTTAQRREAAWGFVLLQLDVDALLAPLGRTARVSDGSVVLGETAAGVGDDRAGLAVPIGTRRWLVEVPARTVGIPLDAVLALLAGAAGALGVVALHRSTSNTSRRAADRARARSHQAETLRRVAPVVQQSQDLGDVLPAVAVLLQEDLGVDGFDLAAHGPDGVAQEVFASGRPVDLAVPPTAEVVALPPGDTLAVALRRADREVAVLRVRASRGLDPLEVESVRAAAELLAAALSTSQAFERQEAAMVALREVDELKNVFLGVASHELRTPVTAIGGFARLLHERWDQLPEDQRRNLASRIEANAASLGVLVQDLLDFSRLERGRFVVGSESVDLAARLEAVVDRLGPIWGDGRVDVSITDRPVVLGDGDAIERVAANLLSNAAKFSPDGSPIGASLSVDGGDAVLVVDDAGPGVPEEERAHIYSAFFRGAGDAVVRTRGAGIGLSVVKEVVDQMGGAISVGSSPAGGARFEVRLPLEARSPEPVGSAS